MTMRRFTRGPQTQHGETASALRMQLSRPAVAQFLIRCPRCQEQSAVHVDESGNDGPVLVRVICPDLCAPDLGVVFDLVATNYAAPTLAEPVVA